MAVPSTDDIFEGFVTCRLASCLTQYVFMHIFHILVFAHKYYVYVGHYTRIVLTAQSVDLKTTSTNIATM